MQPFSLDQLDNTQFEQFCYDLLGEMGFVNLDWRKGTGLNSSPSDRGRDIQGEYIRTDPDGAKVKETWFFECKHYKQGVPPTVIQGALAWANAEHPSRLVIIASNFLSNPTKDYLKDYRQQNHPPFEIKYWELKDIERLTAGKIQLLRKYGLSGEFPFVQIMHPAHLRYLREMPLNRLWYIFESLELLSPSDRDAALYTAYCLIKSVGGGDIPDDDPFFLIDYADFKRACFDLAESNVVEECAISSMIVTYSLQHCLAIGDITSIEKDVKAAQRSLESLQQQLTEIRKQELASRMIEHHRRRIEDLPEQRRQGYALYKRFCETVIEQLLAEDYFR